ncbi:MAG: hypothetical protein R3F48_13870 [Candidatus Zixiibacteriota bacterium]
MKSISRVSFLFVLSVLVAGCGLVICINPETQTAKEIFEANQIVAKCQFSACDTILNIGNLKRYDDDYSSIVIEYSYKVVEMYKGNEEYSVIRLWYPQFLEEDIDSQYQYEDIKITSEMVLIYGKIVDEENLGLIMAPISGDIYLQLGKEELTNRNLGWIHTNTPEADSTLYHAIVNSTELASRIRTKSVSSVIIYGTDRHYHTYGALLRDKIYDCECMRPFRNYSTKEEYFQKLAQLGDDAINR